MKTNFAALLTIIIFVFLFAGTAMSQEGGSKKDKSLKDSPIKIKNKPSAAYGTKCPNGGGTTVLKVTFDKSAKVTNVLMVSSSGCDAFDRSAIKAASNIKFKPAVKNGEPVTIVKTATYTFGTY